MAIVRKTSGSRGLPGPEIRKSGYDIPGIGKRGQKSGRENVTGCPTGWLLKKTETLETRFAINPTIFAVY